MKLWGLEPARIVGLVGAILSLLVTFGVKISGEQVSAIKAVTDALLIVLGAEIIRSQVTPVKKIKVALGQEAADNAKNITGKDIESHDLNEEGDEI